MAIIKNSNQLGKIVRKTRKHLGLTQPQLSLAAKVGVRFIVELEAGKPTVQFESVFRVLDSLGLELQLGNVPSEMQNGSMDAARRGLRW